MHVSLVGIVIDLAFGGACGFLGGLFGIGGGVIAIPLLGVVYGFTEQVAQGTSLVMVVPNVALGLRRYFSHGNMDKRLAITLACCAVPCTYVAARFATELPSTPLRIGFAVWIFALASFILYQTFVGLGAAREPAPWPVAGAVGAIGGILSGLFSVGGASFAVPAMSVLFALPQATAQGMGLALVAPGTLVGISEYAAAHDVAWITGIPLAIGGITTVSLGVDVAHRLPDRTLRLLFAGFLVAASIALWVKH